MDINIKLNDPKLINYIKTIEPDQLNNKIEELLKLSLTVINSANINVNNQDNLNGLINKQIDLLYTLTGHVNNPVKKGQIGENLVNEILDQYCSKYGISYQNTTKKTHHSDYLLEFKENSKIYKILLEIKHYKNTVPKKEITKFKNDLKSTDIQYGILCSLTSGIVYKHQFHWKKTKNNGYIMYIPNAGVDCLSLIHSIWFMKSLILSGSCKSQSEKNVSYNEIIKNLNELKESIRHIKKISEIIDKFENNLRNYNNETEKEISQFRSEFVDLQIGINNKIEIINKLHKSD